MTTSQTLALVMVATSAAILFARAWGRRQRDRGWNEGREEQIEHAKRLRPRGARGRYVKKTDATTDEEPALGL